MIYLLHFDQPVGTARHYLGTCLDDRLDQRLLEHARGNGANLVRVAMKRGIKVRLARTIPNQHSAVERQLKNAGHMKKLCPLCCPMLAHFKAEAYVLDPKRGEQPPARAILDWRQ